MSTSVLSNRIKTWSFLAVLGAMLIGAGGLLAGQGGMVVALVFAVVLNGVAYWKSDSIALRANGARPLAEGELPQVRDIVGRLSRAAALPMPRLYVVDRPEPNAFATGRDPSHSAIAVTTGLLAVLDDREVEGVLAHELSHIRSRDTLVGTVAATFAGAISFLAQMAQFQLLFGGGEREGRNPLGLIAAMILAPIAALLVQLAVSRSREYLADSSGAALTRDPEGLARALVRLEATNQVLAANPRFRQRSRDMAPAPNPAFAHLYLVNPLSGRELGALFSTHPPIEERVARLRGYRAR